MTSTVTETETNMSVQCEVMQEIYRLPTIPRNKWGNILVNDETPLGQCYITEPNKKGKITVGIITMEYGNKVFRYLSRMTKRGWIQNWVNIANAFNKSLSLAKWSEEYTDLVEGSDGKLTGEFVTGFRPDNSLYYKNQYNETKKELHQMRKKLVSADNKGTTLESLIDKLKEEQESLKKIKEDDEGDLNNMAQTLTGMFKKYTNLESRQEWANNEKLKKTGLEQYFCVDCGTFEVFEDKVKPKKCIHNNCPGMCSGCFDIKNPEGFEVCSCCNKKQEFECPICYTTRSYEFIVNGKNCSHSICCLCYTNADRGGNKIDNCPMCRTKF